MPLSLLKSRSTLPNLRGAALALGLIASAALPIRAQEAKPAATKPRVADHPGQYVDLLGPDGQPRVRYVYARDKSTEETTFDTSKVFAHVMAPGGEQTLTSGPGAESYPHHRGIFVGWNKTVANGKSHDFWHAKETALEHVSFETGQEPHAVFVRGKIRWVGKDGEAVVDETRTYRLVDSQDAYAVIDVTTELKAAGADVELGGDPEHAGVQFRPSQQVADAKGAKYTFHAEGIDPTKDLDLPWVACSFLVDGKPWTVQQIDHPDNPRGARWSAYRDYGRFGAFPVIKLTDGKSQTLKYRFRVIPGETPSRESLSAAAAEYAK